VPPKYRNIIPVDLYVKLEELVKAGQGYVSVSDCAKDAIRKVVYLFLSKVLKEVTINSLKFPTSITKRFSGDV
jgi:hypothetical protein